MTIGSRPDPDSRCFFRGIIDEVCLYDRALSHEEIQLLYRSVAQAK